MEMIIFIGAQAAGKSSFYKSRFSDTHIRVNLDMLRTRNRERILVDACLRARQPLVIDNTNATRLERQTYIQQAKELDCQIEGFYFQSRSAECISRNQTRDRTPLPDVPDIAVRHTIAKLELPLMSEGFDKLHFVRITLGSFQIEDWKDEV